MKTRNSFFNIYIKNNLGEEYNMAKTIILKDPDKWDREYTVKQGISLQAVHDYQALAPKEGDKEPEAKTEAMIRYLLKYSIIEPKVTDETFKQDDFNYAELLDVYNIITIKYHLLPDVSQDELTQMQTMTPDQLKQYQQDIALGRINDLKKKHNL